MWIVKHRKIFFGISIALTVISIALFVFKGIPQSIEFKGGALLEIAYTENVATLEEVQSAVDSLDFGITVVQPTGENGYIVKTKSLTEIERQGLMESLSIGGTYKVEEKSFTSIGPSVGRELKHKATVSLILVVLAIVLFIAYAFRKISLPISSWKYGFTAIFTLGHDVIVTAGTFAVFGIFLGAEADTLFIVALLTVLGVSVNDTIVVFDRIRENLQINTETKNKEEFETTVGKSITQTMERSVNTSLTVVIVLLALYFFGPDTTKIFALTMTVGMIVGTFSSIFLASPLLVVWQKMQEKKELAQAK